MDSFVTKIKTNLNGVLQMTQIIDGIMMTGDDRANQIIVELHRDREPYEIPTGTKIVGYFMRSDGVTLEIEGSVVDTNHVMVVVPALAYQIPGVLSIAIRMFVDPSQEEQRGYYTTDINEFILVTDPNVTEGPNGEPVLTRIATVYANKIVIAAASCFVQITETNTIIEPGHLIPDIQDVIAKLAELDAMHQQVLTAESSRVSAEELRDTAEQSRASAESTRQSNEQARVSAESTRQSNEQARVSAESTRQSNEQARGSAEQERAQAEATRQSNETARVNAENVRISNENARQTAIQGMTVGASQLTYDQEPTATISNVAGHKHIQFGLPVGRPFQIKKTFTSVSAMTAYTGTDIEPFDMVMINSNVEDPNNARLYMRSGGNNGWIYITDLSGAQGIQGPSGPQGVGIASTSLVNYQLEVTYTDGHSQTLSPSIQGPQGVGIQQVSFENYGVKFTMTNGDSYTTPSLRGEKGEKGEKGDPGAGGLDLQYDSEQDRLTVMVG